MANCEYWALFHFVNVFKLPFWWLYALCRCTAGAAVRPNEIWDVPPEIPETLEAFSLTDRESVNEGDFRSLSKKELQVRISHVVSPSKIFIQWLSSEHTLKRYLNSKNFSQFQDMLITNWWSTVRTNSDSGCIWHWVLFNAVDLHCFFEESMGTEDRLILCCHLLDICDSKLSTWSNSYFQSIWT